MSELDTLEKECRAANGARAKAIAYAEETAARLATARAEAEKVVYDSSFEKDNVYCRSDYAGFVAGEYSFYYGYEATAVHPLFASEDAPEERETWAFVVCKNGVEVFKRPIYAEHVDWNCLKGLCTGIAFWIKDKQDAQKQNPLTNK